MAAVTWAQLDFKCQEMACNKKEPKVVLPKLACLSEQDVVPLRTQRHRGFKTVFSIWTLILDF